MKLKNILVCSALLCANQAIAAVNPPTPSSITQKISAMGVALEWPASTTGFWKHYHVETKTSGGTWQRLAPSTYELSLNLDGGYDGVNDFVVLKYKTNSSQSGLQFRIKGCHQFCTSNWSVPTTPVNVSNYNRNTADSNGDGIRDDVAALAEWLEPKGSQKHGYLMHYAKFLQRLVNNNYGPSSNMHQDFWQISHAIICAGDMDEISQIKGVILDSDNAIRRYLRANNDYANSTYSTWPGPSSCGISTSSTNNLTSYEQAEAENITIPDDALFAERKDGSTTEVTSAKKGFKHIIYINGVLNNEGEARANRGHLEELIRGYGRSDINVHLSHNFSEGVYLDLVQAFKQYVSEPNSARGYYQIMRDISRYNNGLATMTLPASVITSRLARVSYTNYREHDDYVRVRTDINNRIKQGSVVIVAHSQGNFFANEVWEEINKSHNGNAKSFLRIYGLGTPASYIPENFYYYTNTKDIVVNGIRAVGHTNPLPANISISSDDSHGHGFQTTYLKPGASHTNTTIERILTYFDEMDPTQPGTCKGLPATRETTASWTPSTDGWNGSLKVSLNAYEIADSFNIVDQHGRILFNTGSMTGSLIRSFSYNADINGKLTLNVIRSRSYSDHLFTVLCN